MLALIAGILCAALLLFAYSLRKRPVDPRIPRPAAQATPYFGALLEIIANFETMEVWLLDQCRLIGFGKCWSVSGLRVGGLKEGTIFLGNPAAVKHVLKDNQKANQAYRGQVSIRTP